MSRRRGGDARGAVLVEFILVLPLLLLLLLAAIDWGWYFVLRQSAIDATREGARTGSVQADPATAEAAAMDAVARYLERAGMPAHIATIAFPPTIAGEVIEVTLEDYPAGSLTGFSTFVPATLTARTTMRLEVQP